MSVEKYLPEALSPQKLRQWNLEKYHMFSMILEFLVDNKQINNLPDVFVSSISGMLQKQGIPKYDEKFAAKVNNALLHMAWIGLISIDEDKITIEDEGIKAYKDQRYHEIAANLYNAEQTRKLSVIAIWVASILSGLSIISTIVIACIK